MFNAKYAHILKGVGIQVQVQVFTDTLAAQRPNNLIKQEKVRKHVNNTINLRNEEKGQAH